MVDTLHTVLSTEGAVLCSVEPVLEQYLAGTSELYCRQAVVKCQKAKVIVANAEVFSSKTQNLSLILKMLTKAKAK